MVAGAFVGEVASGSFPVGVGLGEGVALPSLGRHPEIYEIPIWVLGATIADT